MVAEKHLLPAKDRKDAKNATKFKRTENILAEIYADYANGYNRSEIKSKLMNGMYEAQEGRAVKEAMALAYLRMNEERVRQDFDNKRGEMADRIALGYMTVYQDALDKGDRMSAVKALDGLAKLAGLSQPQTAIQINGSSDGTVQVNFGFTKKDAIEDGDTV